MTELLFSGPKTAPQVDPKTDFELSDFKTLNSESLSYKMTPEGLGKRSLMTITYDPQTLRITSRKAESMEETPPTQFVETYPEFIPNADIPDENFKLPDEKK